MSHLNQNINLPKMYEYQIESATGEEYEKYLKYLQYFFQKPHKKDKYKREIIDDKYVLIDNSNPNKKITITPAKFINMHQYYVDLKNNVNQILHKILYMLESKNNFTNENRNEYNVLKERYAISKKKIDDINEIDAKFYKEIIELNSQKLKKADEMIVKYNKKSEAYSKIKKMITENVKREWMDLYKKNKFSIPSGTIITQLAKKNQIPADEVEAWFDWIENGYYYLLLQKDIRDLDKKIEDKEKRFELNTEFMIIQKPNIEES